MSASALTPVTERWPLPDSQPRVLLITASDQIDRRVIDAWLAEAQTTLLDGAELRIAYDGSHAVPLAADDDAWIVPMRVAWLPPGDDGDRRWRARDLLRMSRTSGFSAGSRERILEREPSRCRILVTTFRSCLTNSKSQPMR